MKILSVKLTNFQKLEDLSLDPNGQIVYVLGKNESGKSTLWRAIEGVCLRKGFSARPITKGKDKGSAEIIVGEPSNPQWKIIQKFSEANPEGTIEVVSCTNSQISVKKPVAFLKEILGDVNFEINEFLRLSAKEKANVIKRIAGLDFSNLDAQRKAHYENRTLVGREGERLKSQLEALGIPESDYELYAEEKQAGDISKRIQEAIAHNHKVGDVYYRAQGLYPEVEKLEEQIQNKEPFLKSFKETYSKSIHDMQANLNDIKLNAGHVLEQDESLSTPIDFTLLEQSIYNFREAKASHSSIFWEQLADKELLKDLKDGLAEDEKFLNENKSIDVEAIQKEYDTLIEYNNTRNKVIEAKKLSETIDSKRQEYKDLTDKINNIDHEKERLIREAKMPVEGLGFDEEGLTLNGLPFDEKTQSKSIIAITAVKIYLAMSPPFPVVYLDASTLDSDNLKELDTFMRDNNLQGFIEKVVDGEGLTIQYELN